LENNMNLTLALLGLSLYILIWEKLPDWGTWFNTIIKYLPKPLAYLYQAWRCPFCFGFWAALALHGLTGLYTLPDLAAMSASMTENLGQGAIVLLWFLDALATASLIMVGQLSLHALAVPAIKGHQMTIAFKQSKTRELSAAESSLVE
jgi:hypothetical protein